MSYALGAALALAAYAALGVCLFVLGTVYLRRADDDVWPDDTTTY